METTKFLSRLAHVGEAVREKGTTPPKTIGALRSGSKKSIGFAVLAMAVVACDAPDACEQPLSYPTRELEDGALSASINLLVVPVYEASQPPPTTYLTEDLLQGFYFDYPNSVADFYDGNSDGNVVLEGDVHPDLVGVSTECYYEQRQGFYDDLLSTAEKSISDFWEYNAFSFVLLDIADSDKAWSQIGTFLEGPYAGIRANFIPSNDIDMHGSSVPAHELGHGLGLLHASSYDCDGDLPLGIEYLLPADCVYAYGDNTLMGDSMGKGDLDASQRRRLGATIPSETVTSTGTFSLLQKTVPSVQTLEPEQLMIPTSGGYFSLEYDHHGDGVEIRFVPEGTSRNSVVDTIRVYKHDDEGTTWADEGRNISVEIGSLTPEEATIIVNSL